jgi:hypothetical protein
LIKNNFVFKAIVALTRGDSLDDALTCLQHDDPTLDCIGGDAYLQAEFQCIHDLSNESVPSTQQEAYRVIEICFSDVNDQAKVKAFFDQRAATATTTAASP